MSLSLVSRVHAWLTTQCVQLAGSFFKLDCNLAPSSLSTAQCTSAAACMLTWDPVSTAQGYTITRLLAGQTTQACAIDGAQNTSCSVSSREQ